ncbi:response regulator transcription factor [Nocardioides anomalus]|uniref:Response regulator transcription factor n=1 Tax=Nocardioides anomalus TaxID=2712223 RepID=A0A6G6W9A5_9ACTN|nr:response regulator transcription factor [Nocardioides anomalus]QIG41802.1 response regulator transcription factor [Nocardioides anomalus]
MTEQRYAVVIEDDVDARELTELVLTQSGFTVVTAEDGPSGIEAVRTYDPLITTCDVQMPGMDGFAVTKRIREFSLTYLIMVTSMASEIDIIQGFESGADDYLVKPFRPRELRARADAMLRRMRLGGPAANGAGGAAAAPAAKPEATGWATEAARELRENPLPPTPAFGTPPAAEPAPAAPAGPRHVAPVDEPTGPPPPTPLPVREPAPEPATPLPEPAVASGAAYVGATTGLLEHAGIKLDAQTGRTTYQGRALDLSPQEFDLLSTLMHTGRRVRSKADLVLALRGQNYITSHFVNEADKRQVDAHIASLRTKLGDDAASPTVIETVRGVGYRLAS